MRLVTIDRHYKVVFAINNEGVAIFVPDGSCAGLPGVEDGPIVLSPFEDSRRSFGLHVHGSLVVKDLAIAKQDYAVAVATVPEFQPPQESRKCSAPGRLFQPFYKSRNARSVSQKHPAQRDHPFLEQVIALVMSII